jgi:hypothetical protein
MNREIKFRGKSIQNGKYFMWDNGWQMQVDANTIGQYTGLKDKNGKEIYEGDILRLTIPDGSTRHFVVEWATEDRKLMPLSGFEHDGNDIRISGWCFNWEGHHLYPTVIGGVPDNEVMEIVGNIHDNPELLKGVK